MIGVSGHLSIFSHDPSVNPLGVTQRQFDDLLDRGDVRQEFAGKNLIVTSGLAGIAAKLGHALGSPSVGGQTPSDVDDLQVAEMQVGNAANPAAPLAGDTVLADLTPLVTLTSLTVSYPSSGQVRFAATIPVNTQNGQGITEAGLFWTINATKILVGRRVVSPVVVISPGLAYTLNYDITFTAA